MGLGQAGRAAHGPAGVRRTCTIRRSAGSGTRHARSRPPRRGRSARPRCSAGARGARPPRSTVGPFASGWPRTARRSWCCAGLSPASCACCSLQWRKRRSSVRNSRSRAVVVVVELLHEYIVPRWINTSCHDMIFAMRSHPASLLLSALGALLGLIGGGAAWVLVHLIGLVTSLALFHQWSWEAPSFTELDRSPLIPLVAMAGALAVTPARPVGAGHPRPRHPRGDGGGARAPEPHRAPGRAWPSRSRRRSPSAPVDRSAPRGRSS